MGCQDHKPELPGERARIESAGAYFPVAQTLTETRSRRLDRRRCSSQGAWLRFEKFSLPNTLILKQVNGDLSLSRVAVSFATFFALG